MSTTFGEDDIGRFRPGALDRRLRAGRSWAPMVLNSSRAVEMSVYVIRAFVQLRVRLSSSRELALQLQELEGRLDKGSLNTTKRSRRSSRQSVS